MVETVDILGTPHAYELTPARNSPCVLVFVHGWLLSREYWQPVIERLSPTYQCLSYDLRGFGDSQPDRTAGVGSLDSVVQPSGVVDSQNGSSLTATAFTSTAALPCSPYAPAAYARDLSLVLEQLNISTAWLIGHSLGGSIALWTADRAPQQVKGVVCVNSGGGIYLKEEFERFRAAGQQLVKLRPRWLCHLPLLDWPMARMNVARPIARQWAKQRLTDWVMAQPEAAVGTLLDSTTEAEVHSLPQVVSRLQQPVYFIAGEKDTIMEPQYVRHLASFHYLFDCCGRNVVEIPNCGHLSMVEQPDQVAQYIQSILTKHSV